MSHTIITGYYAQQDEARKALLELTRKGFGAAVLIQKGADGVTQTVDPFSRRRVIRVGFCGHNFWGIWHHYQPFSALAPIASRREYFCLPGSFFDVCNHRRSGASRPVPTR